MCNEFIKTKDSEEFKEKIFKQLTQEEDQKKETVENDAKTSGQADLL